PENRSRKKDWPGMSSGSLVARLIRESRHWTDWCRSVSRKHLADAFPSSTRSWARPEHLSPYAREPLPHGLLGIRTRLAANNGISKKSTTSQVICTPFLHCIV